jgi:hypothetical protein
MLTHHDRGCKLRRFGFGPMPATPIVIQQGYSCRYGYVSAPALLRSLSMATGPYLADQ